jgi:ATP-binding protein involved in chromosome partitioning
MTPETPNSNALDPQFARQLMSEAKAGLINASAHEESGLSDASHHEIRERVVSVTKGNDGKPQVRVDSTGLSLDHKLFIERVLLRHLDSADFSLAGVYFQRGVTTPVTSSPVPAPTSKKSPFGLKIEKQMIPGVKSIVAVASGKGGVGKSTVATNLAVALAKSGLAVGLMDCDVYGPSSPQMLGARGQVEVHGSKMVPLTEHGVKMMSLGLLSDVRTPVIWRGPMVSKAIEQLCFDVDWGTLDLLILDLPPGTGDVQMTLAEKVFLTGAVIVTTPQDVALIDAQKAVSMFEKLQVPVIGAIENMAFHRCGNCGHTDHIFGSESFGEFLTARKLRLLGQIPLHKDIRVAGDLGKPVAAGDGHLAQVYSEISNIITKEVAAASAVKPANHKELH